MLKVVATLAVILQVLPLLVSATLPQGVDSKYIDIIGGKYYYFSSVDRNVVEAITLCTEINMTLVSFETREEYDAVNNYISTNLGTEIYHWTSGTRQLNTWIWSSIGRQITFFDWYPTQPDITDLTTQTNLCIYNGLMCDGYPSYTFKFICEQA